MALYFKDIEITNIDNLVPQTGLDITDIWFGSTNVYTVWQIYEGTLPATINANGDDMRQYQVWGDVGGVGDKTGNYLQVTPDMHIANNWELVQLSPTDPTKYFMYFELPQATKDILSNLGEVYANAYLVGTYYNGLVFAITDDKYSAVASQYRVIQNNGDVLSWAKDISNWEHIYLCIGYGAGIATGNKQTLINALFGNYNLSLTEGTTAPASFVPFGYEVDISVSDGTNATTTPIYIGDEPLDKDEYVDYTEQKVYRMINGVLTPTDPPVPLPVLPTCEGTTVINYGGQSVEPEKVLLKYRKEGY